jgi:2-polyprenyl-3-methyl-5-hydroxy-6-metoxy-1,4-benzoquinol methylase
VEKHTITYEKHEPIRKNQKNSISRCWVCDSNDLVLAKESNIGQQLCPSSFAITDSDYGITGELHRCLKCGFVQCNSISDVTGYYEGLEDKSYEASRAEREIQALKLLNLLYKYRQQGRLLDIGAGSGILIEQAKKLGYEPEGVEPSRWLQRHATERGLIVHLGTFPHKDIKYRVDIVTIVDVIEHVTNPIELLQSVREIMEDNGIGLIVTPDLDSIAARIMGNKWWHYRVAHIGYFNKKTLEKALNRSGLEVVKWGRPIWYFSVSYLLQRAIKYLPGLKRMPTISYFNKTTIPINLRDSLYVIFKKRSRER